MAAKDVSTAEAEFYHHYDALYGEEYGRLTELLTDLKAAVRREAAQTAVERAEQYATDDFPLYYVGAMGAAAAIDSGYVAEWEANV